MTMIRLLPKFSYLFYKLRTAECLVRLWIEGGYLLLIYSIIFHGKVLLTHYSILGISSNCQ